MLSVHTIHMITIASRTPPDAIRIQLQVLSGCTLPCRDDDHEQRRCRLALCSVWDVICGAMTS